MEKSKNLHLIFFLVLISFFIVFGARSTFACSEGGGGEGGGGSDSATGSSSPSTGIKVQSAELAAFEEAALFDQYNQGLDRMEAEFQPINSEIGQRFGNNQAALNRAEFFAWMADKAEGLGDTLWGGIPGTSNANERAPGDTGGDTQPIEVYTNRASEPAGFGDVATFFAWNAPLNITRTLGYGMLGGNNETVYNVNQQSRSGQAINNFIANMNYTGRRAGHLPSHQGSSSNNSSNTYNIVGEQHEAPMAE